MTGRILTPLVAAVAVLAAACGPPSVKAPRLVDEHVTVVEFASDESVVTAFDSPHATFGFSVAEQIASDLQHQGHTAESIPATATPAGAVVVHGRITKIDGGSRALRYWIGFGAGAARFMVAGEVDRADGTRIGSFSAERSAGFGMWGGASEDMMVRCIRAVGKDVAEMIDKGEYSQE
jgi:hypothetical protein